MNRVSDILIIGGGIIGLSLAIELKLRGATVTTLTRNFQEAATHAAGGMLAPQAEQIPASPMLDLCLQSRAIYADWTQKLTAITGVETGYWPCGILSPIYEIENRDIQPSPISNSLVSIWLDREAVRQHEPGLSSEVVGGWWYPEDAQVDNRVLAKTLWIAARQLGVNLLEGVNVEKIQTENGKVTCIQTSAGDWQAQTYVLATGAWSKDILPLPVYPTKGQMLSVRVPSDFFRNEAENNLPLKQVFFGPEVYVIPRKDGRIVIGATSENVGFTAYNTPAGIQDLLAKAMRIYPQLQYFPIEEFWWGFRPTTPDELPILGWSAYENLALATGHHRNGILLAPITALLIADLILDRQVNPILSSFSWQRFDDVK